MNLLGVRLTLMIGPTVAVPAPPTVADALQSVEVTESDQGRSGFQLTFSTGRSGPEGLIDHALLLNPLLRPFNRVIVMIVLDVLPVVLMDGIITHQQLSPGDDPGTSTITVTGEDVSVMMDLVEKERRTPGPGRDRHRPEDHRELPAVRAHPRRPAADDDRPAAAGRADADPARRPTAPISSRWPRGSDTSSTSGPVLCRSRTSPTGGRRSESACPSRRCRSRWARTRTSTRSISSTTPWSPRWCSARSRTG